MLQKLLYNVPWNNFRKNNFFLKLCFYFMKRINLYYLFFLQIAKQCFYTGNFSLNGFLFISAMNISKIRIQLLFV